MTKRAQRKKNPMHYEEHLDDSSASDSFLTTLALYEFNCSYVLQSNIAVSIKIQY